LHVEKHSLPPVTQIVSVIEKVHRKKYSWKCNYFCVFQPFVKYSMRRDYILRLQKTLALVRKKFSNSYKNHAKKWRFMFSKCLGCEITNTFMFELYLYHNFKFHLKPCKYPVLIKVVCISNNTFYIIVEKIWKFVFK
jgi:hypothetical protein